MTHQPLSLALYPNLPPSPCPLCWNAKPSIFLFMRVQGHTLPSSSLLIQSQTNSFLFICGEGSYFVSVSIYIHIFQIPNQLISYLWGHSLSPFSSPLLFKSQTNSIHVYGGWVIFYLHLHFCKNLIISLNNDIQASLLGTFILLCLHLHLISYHKLTQFLGIRRWYSAFVIISSFCLNVITSFVQIPNQLISYLCGGIILYPSPILLHSHHQLCSNPTPTLFLFMGSHTPSPSPLFV